MQTIIYDYSAEYSGCGVTADLPDGDGVFFNTFEEFLSFVDDAFPGAELIPLFGEDEDEYC